MPRPVILGITRFYLGTTHLLEKYIIGLNYEIRGSEHLPIDGTYIVAAKHQSAYETLKLHRLFGDPTIILKQELMKIPLFGKFLSKIDVIPINRRNKEESIRAIVAGAKRMQKNNRPIIIFPQGTRVPVSADTKQKPYKGGIVKMYAHTDIPIIPMALNSGLFWPRKSFIKRPGTVIFEFLAPIEPGLPDKKVMKALEDRIEEKTYELMQEAKNKYKALEPVKIATPASTA
jgi:1-acyl-sn-glycerol-3-phosphate acyltransferase